MYVLPHVIDVDDEVQLPIRDRSASLGEREYLLSFHLLHVDDQPVEAAVGIDLLRHAARRHGMQDVSFDNAEAWGYSETSNLRTLVTVSTVITADREWGGDDILLNAPDACGQVLLNFHRTYKAHNSHPLPDLTWERLWVNVPVMLSYDDGRSYTFYGWKENASGQYGFEMFDNTVKRDDEHWGKLQSAYERFNMRDLTLAYYESIVQAQTERLYSGRYSEAVVQSAVAAESLITTLSLMLAWETTSDSDADVEAAARWHNKGLTARCEHMQHYLGNDFASVSAGAWAGWDKDVRRVRNRVVHAHYRASTTEAEVAVNTVASLRDAINAALVDKCKQYPKTCLSQLSGGDIHEVKGRRGDRVRALLADAYKDYREGDEPVQAGWVRDFSAWREKVLQKAETLQRAR